jgi:predicted secreted Zn-dependent protease
MKTTVAWGTKNTGAKFTVNGADLESALDALSKRDEWGRFEGNLTYDSKGDANKNVTSVTIKASYTITMPSWPVAGKQPKTCQDEWNRMCKALRGHEDGHLAVFEKGVAALVKELTALKTGTQDDVESIFNKALADIQTGHNKYDASTKHGQTEGVELTIADECAAE